jgi:Zn-dependent peptidase ImmA (M78 family)
MPEERVREEWHRAASAAELAESFGVSAEAMTWRLYSFGLVEEPPG